MGSRSSFYRVTLLTSIIFLVMSFFSPLGYSYGYILTLFSITLAEVIMYFIGWGKTHKNFLDFEPIFLIIAMIMGFTFPLLIYAYDNNTAYAFSWGLTYSLNYFNKGACLTALGITSFMAGSLKSQKEKFTPKSSYIRSSKLDSTLLVIGLMIILLLFVYLGGFERYQKIYHNEDDTSAGFLTYIEVFIIAFAEVIVTNECWNALQNPKYKLFNKNIIFVSVVALLFAAVGNRTFALFIILPIVIFGASNYFKLSFSKFLVAIAVGAIIMVGLQFYRSGTDYNSDMDWYYNVTDLMIPNTTTYLACEIVDNTGITFGLSMLGGSILGAIPFSQTILKTLTGIGGDLTNSSSVFTAYLGSKSGTGTNFVSDPYLGFGAIGVFVFVYLSGYVVNWARRRSSTSYYALLVYLIFCGFAVYAVRSSLLYSIRFIFYAVITAYINLKLTKKCV